MKFNLSTKTLFVLAVFLFGSFIIASFFAVASTNIFSQIFRSSYDFQKLTPGVSTTKDIEKTAGAPESTENINGKTKLNYSTKSLDYKDIAVTENDKLIFSVENIFDDSLGTLTTYKNRFGDPDFVLFDHEDEVLRWNIFLKGGVGIAAFDEEGIARILYFKPQTSDEFMKNIAPQVGLLKDQPSHFDE